MNPPLPRHALWMQNTTLGITSPRSTPLKALDAALQQYELAPTEAHLWRVRNAFEDWKRAQGPTWTTSDRNRNGAVTALNSALAASASYGAHQRSKFTPQELQALAFVRQQRAKVIRSVFEGRRVTLKASKLKDRAQEAAQAARGKLETAAVDIRSRASRRGNAPAPAPAPAPVAQAGPTTASQVKDKMIETVQGYFGVEGLALLGDLGGLVLSIIEKTALNVPPVVGHIKDGYDLFTGWAKVGSLYVHQRSIGERSYAIDTGVPQLAFDAVVKCLKEETKNEAIGATTATTSFALKTGLAFVDGGAISGPVVGAVAALAEVMHTVALLAIEWRASRAINTALEADQLDVRLFRTYPLMGCYLMTSATLSDLIPIESFGTPGWMDYIENLKKHQFDPIYGAAADLIDGSPWEIEGLPKRPKGSAVGFLDQAKRIWSSVSPLGDLADLRSLGKS